MNARNVFNEVERHLDSPAAVEEALKSKTSLNPDTRGYFAAFRYNYFKEKGMWYEPYVHQLPNGDYKLAQVGSARHDYTKSDWYVQAEKILMNFWSKPYYYYDGTRISGHYCTFVEPILNDKQRPLLHVRRAYPQRQGRAGLRLWSRHHTRVDQ